MQSKTTTLILFILLHQTIASSFRYRANDPPPPTKTIWALLVAGSNGWSNYRHQADVCHAYQVLRSHGVDEDHIVTMMYDDIAKNENNPYPGKLYNRPQGADVYAGVVVDYSGDTVTPKNFLQILQGNATAMSGIGTGKVIDSGPDDHIFVFFTDHGASGLVAFPSDILTVKALNDALKSMHRQKKYQQLVFYLEACESGSMFKNILPKNIDVYAITASNGEESSWGCYCDNTMHLPCLGDLFSVNWMEDSDVENIQRETLQKQFEIVLNKTNKSHVQHFGNLSIALESVANFQGFASRIQPRGDARHNYDTNPSIGAWPAHDIPLLTLKRDRQLLLEAALGADGDDDSVEENDEIIEIDKQIQLMLQKRHYLRRKMQRIVHALIHDPSNRRRILKQHPERLTQLHCHDMIAKVFNRICFPFSKNPYALKYVYVLSNLCEESLSTTLIAEVLLDECADIDESLGGIE